MGDTNQSTSISEIWDKFPNFLKIRCAMHLLDLVVLAPRFNKFHGASSCLHFAGSWQSRSELDLSTDSMILSCITPPCMLLFSQTDADTKFFRANLENL